MATNRRASGRRLVLVAAAVAVSALGVVGRDTPSAGAAGSRAVVNVEGSNQVVSFGTMVTGLQALRMVASVTTVGFGGSGEAVCAINGVGNEATPNKCLIGPNGNYWSYWRAAPGATGWQYSSRGAGATSVTDGSVEGWRYGTGGPPPFTSFCAVAGCAPPPTAVPAVPSGGGSTAAAPAPGVDATTSTSTTDPDRRVASSSSEDTEVAGASTDDGSPRSRNDDDGQAAGGTGSAGGEGGSPIGVVAVGGILAALAGGGFALRRRRDRPVPSG